MKKVIYSDVDMEPITVIDVPEWLMVRVRRGEQIRLPVYRQIPETPIMGKLTEVESWSVVIWGERIIRKEQAHWLLFAASDELALILRNTYLPGQMRDVAIREKTAFIKGLMAAFGVDE